VTKIHDNIAVGSFAGHFLASNDNINIGNSGVAGESQQSASARSRQKLFIGNRKRRFFSVVSTESLFPLPARESVRKEDGEGGNDLAPTKDAKRRENFGSIYLFRFIRMFRGHQVGFLFLSFAL